MRGSGGGDEQLSSSSSQSFGGETRDATDAVRSGSATLMMATTIKSEDDNRMCRVIKEEVVDEEEEEEDGSDTASSPSETEVKIKQHRSLLAGTRGMQSYVKQMEQQQQSMSRNYSDFMRSLAAKYNNRNPGAEEQDDSLTHVNGFMHKLDGSVFSRVGSADGILKAATPPLLNANHDDVIRRSDNHSAPPVLLDHHKPTSGHLLRPMVDLSSTQMLLHMMRSACNAAAAATSGAAAEPLSGGGKRHAAEEVHDANALDLSVRANKRWRSEGGGGGCGSFPAVSDPIGLLSRAGGHRGQLSSDTCNSAPTLSRSMPEPSAVADVAHKKSHSNRLSNSHKKLILQQQQQQQHLCASNCACKDKKHSTSAVVKWTVEDVCAFVSGVDACADYVQAFREQSIDGSALYMLTEEHLTNRMKMKLGHALRFKAALAKLIGACVVCLHCVHCHQQPTGQRNGSAVQRQQ